jgi:hypothetical protein
VIGHYLHTESFADGALEGSGFTLDTLNQNARRSMELAGGKSSSCQPANTTLLEKRGRL